MKEDFILPERWAVKITEKNRDVLIDWVKSHDDYDEDYDSFNLDEYIVSNRQDNSYQLWNCNLEGHDYVEISFDDFMKFIFVKNIKQYTKEDVVGFCRYILRTEYNELLDEETTTELFDLWVKSKEETK